MHICYLCDEYPPGPHGGVGSFTQTIARAMVARGHRVTVVGSYPVRQISEETDRGVRVVRVPHSRVPKTGILINGLRLRRALLRLHAQHPIALIEGPELSFARVPRMRPIVNVIRLNGGHHFFAVTLGRRPRAWRSWMERRSFRRADCFCAVSHFVADVTRRLIPIEQPHIEILPNPVDTNHFEYSSAEPEPDLMVFVGTLCEKKGTRQLVEALPAILRSAPHARLMLVGRDSRDPATGGSYLEMLRGLLPAAQAARIEFTGHVGRNELPALLARASVAVFPSHMESQGLVIVEAMASGRAVVTGRVGPGKEIIEDDVSGLLCDPHDPHSIAACVVRVLGDRSLRIRLGQAARVRAVEVFSEQALLPQTEAFYERCVAGLTASAVRVGNQDGVHA